MSQQEAIRVWLAHASALIAESLGVPREWINLKLAPTDEDRALHRAISLPSPDEKRLGAAQYVRDDD